MAGRSFHRVLLAFAIVAWGLLACPRAWALGDEPVMGETITQYLTPAILQSLFPGADRIGEVGGTPPSAPVWRAAADPETPSACPA